MKSSAIIRIILFSIAILVLLGIFVSVMVFRSFMIDLDESGIIDTVQEIFEVRESDEIRIDGNGRSGEYDATQVRDLEIDWVAGTIIIQPGDTDTIRFEESAVSDTKYQMITKRSGDKLVLQFCEESVGSFGFGINYSNDLSKDLVITVPLDWVCDSLEIDTASARVEIRNLQINEVDFDGASGLCIFENCSIAELDIDTASGDVEFSGTLNTLDFDAASANFHGNLQNTPNSLKMDTMSGDLDITLPEDCGFVATLDTMSGDFSSDFQTTISNGKYTYGNGVCKINVKAMSGDVTIRKN